MCIEVWRGGRRVGYIRSVSYQRGTYTVTKTKSSAKKKYRNDYEVQCDIDACVNHALNRGELLMMGY